MSQTEVVNDSLIARETYRRMLLIRRFEERVIQLVNANEIAGTTHEYIGEEAIAVGVCTMLQQADVITSTHRGHGHIIAKGGDVKRMMAELFGRRTGYNRGKGGSMHIAERHGHPSSARPAKWLWRFSATGAPIRESCMKR